MDYLFNMELPLPVKLLVAFGVVLLLLALLMWIFKRIGGSRVGPTATRGRQPRLAVIDAAAIDGRRRLVLLRRDNVEHLVMIGGPSDILIEQNIMRAVPVAQPRDAMPREAMPREATPREAMAREPMPRLPAEAPRHPAESAQRVTRVDPLARPPRAELPPRRSAEYDRMRGEGSSPRGPMPEPPRTSRLQAVSSRGDSEPPELHPAPPTSDNSLADMAHKLEAALKRPAASRRPEPVEPAAAPPALIEPPPPTAPEVNGNGNTARTPPDVTPGPHAPQPASEPKSAGSQPKPGGKSMFDSLEEEMASLLGRPPDPPEKK